MPAVRRLVPLVLALTAVVAAGCGGDEEKDVRAAFAAFAKADEANDGGAYCNALTPQSVRVIERLNGPTSMTSLACPDVMEGRFGGRGPEILSKADTKALRKAKAEVQGARAELTDPKRGTLPLRRSDGDWLVDLAGSTVVGYRLRATIACSDVSVRALRPELPAPTRAGIARGAEAEARNVRAIRRMLVRAKPPPGRADDARRIDRALRDGVVAWTKAAKALRGVGEPAEVYTDGLNRATERELDVRPAALKLGLLCVGSQPPLPEGEAYIRRAERACDRTVKEIAGKRDPAVLKASLARLIRRLDGLTAPAYVGDLHRNAVRALRSVLKETPRPGSRPAAVERFGLLALRAAIGFRRLQLPTCSEL